MTDTRDYNRKIREDLEIDFRGLRLKTTWGLFSPRAVDEGSRLLLDHLDIAATDDCLDLGCGYGVLGLAMARAAPRGRTLLVDKDFVAIDYAEKNRRLNAIDNAECLLSNGFAQIPRQRFDLIVSNIPAKVGKEMLYIYLYDALDYLKPGGSFSFDLRVEYHQDAGAVRKAEAAVAKLQGDKKPQVYDKPQKGWCEGV